jgi:putative SOS response-associated peptidase YedK
MEGTLGVVPATSFCEPSTKPDPATGKNVWHSFAQVEDRPLFCFAGLWTIWFGVRGAKSNPDKGEHQLFGFLTTLLNATVKAVHEKAMPVILRMQDEIDTWLDAPISEALALQKPSRMMRSRSSWAERKRTTALGCEQHFRGCHPFNEYAGIYLAQASHA